MTPEQQADVARLRLKYLTTDARELAAEADRLGFFDAAVHLWAAAECFALVAAAWARPGPFPGGADGGGGADPVVVPAG